MMFRSLMISFIVLAISLGATTPEPTVVSAATKNQVIAQVAKSLQARSTKFRFNFKATSQKMMLKEAKQIIELASKKDDYTYYVIRRYEYTITYYENSLNVVVDTKVTYWETKAQSDLVTTRSQAALTSLKLTGKSPAVKVKAIHDYIVKKFAYDESLQKYSAYAGYATGETVCQGYALAMFRMLSQAGIPVRIVEGQAEGDDHAWNLVKLGAYWYHVDATFDDPVPDQRGKAQHDYLLLSDSEIDDDHTWVRANYPKATRAY